MPSAPTPSRWGGRRCAASGRADRPSCRVSARSHATSEAGTTVCARRASRFRMPAARGHASASSRRCAAKRVAADARPRSANGAGRLAPGPRPKSPRRCSAPGTTRSAPRGLRSIGIRTSGRAPACLRRCLLVRDGPGLKRGRAQPAHDRPPGEHPRRDADPAPTTAHARHRTAWRGRSRSGVLALAVGDQRAFELLNRTLIAPRGVVGQSRP